ncbi:MAG: PQQ-binding-like beta-propeller repeat protein [Gemmataceae bacterium]
MSRLAITLLLPLASLSLAASRDASQEPSQAWNHLRGPTGQGHVVDDRVPLRWSETDNILWKTRLPGGGNSTPSIVGDRIYLTTSTEAGAVRGVACLRVSDGKQLWHQIAARDLAQEKTHAWNGHASPSCVSDGKHVWAFFGTPGVFCYDIDGKLVWKKAFGTFASKPGWGTAASPFLYRDTVIINCDNDGGPGAAPADLVALEKATGKVRWTTPRNQGRGFSTPRLMTVAGGRIDLVLNGPDGVWGYDPNTGKERWRCLRQDADEKHKFGEPIPVDDGQTMFITSGRPGPFQIVKVPGEGDITASHVLHAGVRKNHRDVSSPILWQGQVYCVDSKGVLSAYDFRTGKELFSGLIGNRSNLSLASPIAIQGKLLWVLDDGMTVVIQPGKSLQVVGRNKLAGEKLDFGASPAVLEGRLYLRSQQYLYCIGNK